ncbi:trypsin-like serine peptidase [Paraliomyxa miuraensis]|uniref:hypothetical protein n=1 Tax=Paraliomyxa miuraensis TaxID=376150 RepID=UPI002257CCEF|nr:hypothetical protein [Paraliomyxa miuraensis]MCX4241776.1 hypothetical protein [Paraliomyxa miuraensis]
MVSWIATAMVLVACTKMGQRVDIVSMSASEVVDAHWIVRIMACEHTRTLHQRCEEGSGYFLDAWPDTVVTARHVVTGKDRFRLSDVVYFVYVWREGRSPARLEARVANHPGRQGSDVAVVLLDGAVQPLREGHGPGSIPSNRPLPAELWGSKSMREFLDSGPSKFPVKDALRRDSQEIEHIHGEGSKGLSGGPLVYDDKVVGTYRGYRGRIVSTVLDIAELTRLRNEALSMRKKASP